jgi:hypothetical protein
MYLVCIDILELSLAPYKRDLMFGGSAQNSRYVLPEVARERRGEARIKIPQKAESVQIRQA